MQLMGARRGAGQLLATQGQEVAGQQQGAAAPPAEAAAAAELGRALM
jgi:hypothetical protein